MGFQLCVTLLFTPKINISVKHFDIHQHGCKDHFLMYALSQGKWEILTLQVLF